MNNSNVMIDIETTGTQHHSAIVLLQSQYLTC